jgi:myo-inositol catabolism protein IolS
MVYKKLGLTDINVSIIGLGTWQFSGEWGKRFTNKEVSQILACAKSIGVNIIDTAECYGDHLSEHLIGSFIKKSGSRDYWILATKFGHKYKGFLDVEDYWTPKDVKRQLENSLEALHTDYLDIYQFHSGSNDVFNNDALWQMLEKEKQSGKIRYLGVSISEKMVLDGDLSQVYKAKEYGIDVIQVRYNWLHREAERVFIPTCSELGLGILVRQPLAYGYLSGKYNSVSNFPKNDVRYWLDKKIFLKDIWLAEKLKEKLGNNVDMAGWSIAWCLKNKHVASVLVGCKTVQQINSIINAIEIYKKNDY